MLIHETYTNYFFKTKANSSRAQDYLMQIVTAGYGFDVDDIQNALMKTNYKSVEAAVEYLFVNQKGATTADTGGSSSGGNGNKNNSNSSGGDANKKQEKEIEELRQRIKKMELEGNFKLDVTEDIMNNAIKQNPNRPDEALNYIMDKYPHLIQSNESIDVNSKQDAEALKRKLKEDALKKKEEQVIVYSFSISFFFILALIYIC